MVMLSRHVVLLSGKVQRGGFRSFVKKQALLHGITGYAENLPTGEVLLVLEGEEGEIEKLLEKVEREAPAFIEVEEIQKRRENYRGSFSDFERKGEDVLEGLESSGTRKLLLRLVSYAKSSDEKLERGIEILGTIKSQQDEMLEKQDRMLEKQDEMLEKQDRMLEKQEEHIEVTRRIAEKQDEMLEKQDRMLEKQEEHIEVTKKGFESVSEELKGYKELHEEIRELREEFARLKEALREAGIPLT